MKPCFPWIERPPHHVYLSRKNEVAILFIYLFINLYVWINLVLYAVSYSWGWNSREGGFLEFRVWDVMKSQKTKRWFMELWDQGSLGSRPLIPSICSYTWKMEVQGNERRGSVTSSFLELIFVVFWAVVRLKQIKVYGNRFLQFLGNVLRWSQNRRMVGVGMDLIHRLVPTPLPWAGTPLLNCLHLWIVSCLPSFYSCHFPQRSFVCFICILFSELQGLGAFRYQTQDLT